MSQTRTRSFSLTAALASAALLTLAALCLLRLSSYGIWDPWELSVADIARKLAEGKAPADAVAQLPVRLVAAGFRAFGAREWGGRLPIALAGLGLLAVTWWFTRRHAGARAASYATLALGTTPFFILHTRLMLGATPSFLASGLVILGAAGAAFAPGNPDCGERSWAPYAWLGVTALGALLGAFSSGVLLSVLPPLAAVALVSLQLRTPLGSARRAREFARWAIVTMAILCAALVLLAVLRRDANFSLWLGGTPQDGAVPTYERGIEQLFHSFAPWSAILPLALAALLRPDGERPDRAFRLLCVLWSAFGYAAHTLFLSSYGQAAFPAPIALAGAAAIWLEDRAEDRRSYWPEAVIALLLLGLVIRDYALYPASPLGGLSLGEVKLPAEFNPKHAWSAVFGAFCVGLVVSCMATPDKSALDLKAPYRGIRRLFGTSWGHKAWLLVAALLCLGLVIFGGVALIPSVPLTSLARRVGRIAGIVPIAIPIGVALGQVAFVVCAQLAALRHALLLATALGVAGYASQGFMPALSGQFSPRGVFDIYNQLAGKAEPLVQHNVESGAASYYAKGQVRDIKSRAELLSYLVEPGRRWAAFPGDQLADIDVAFRRKTSRHLFVPSADGRVILAASEPVPGKPDANPLAQFVLAKEPTIAHRVEGKFEDKIELVGYNVELPGKDHVGAGQTFRIAWIWRALQGNLGTYKIFVHLDAPNQRVNGDHEPVDGKYPVRLWDEGDVIVDRQEISMPATARPGSYTLYVGLYRGDARLKVVSGQQDGQDRLNAGSIEVR